jgi:NAD(P)-dependent dehydrogenase (short-subunit alcohol dehydrogenase family)
MKKKRIILLVGYKGLIGKELHKFFSSEANTKLIKMDKKIEKLDISNSRELEFFFKKNQNIEYIVNASGKNDHVEKIDKNINGIEDEKIVFDYIRANVIGPKNLIELSSKYCKNLKSIINFSSLYGLKSPFHPMYNKKKSLSYCISKHALEGLTKYYSTILAKKKIRINNLRLGCVKSNQPKKFKLSFINKTPINRLLDVKEISPVVDFLCSEKSSYIIGENISLDGGYRLW